MDRRKVDYFVIYKGSETVGLIPGKKYKCIEEDYDEGKLFSLAIIDESEEDYMYPPDYFEKE